MAILRRIADACLKLQTAIESPAIELQQRAAVEPSWAALRGGIDLGGPFVSPHMAENLSTVTACVSAISNATASLPCYVYRSEGKGRTIDETHPISRLIEFGANEHQSWPDFIEWLMASVLLRGNALAEIVSDGRGTVVGLKPVPWEYCNIQLLPTGRLVFDITDLNSVGGTGRMRRLLQDQVLHLRDRSDDGLIGRSRLQRAASVLQVGAAVQSFAASIYANGVIPSGVVEVDGELTKEQREALASRIKTLYSRTSNAGKVLILDQAAKWKTISMSAEDAEFLASRRFAVEELARLFGCPPPVIGDLSHGTFTNSETVLRWFAQGTLSYWIRKLEAEFQRSVFTNGSRRLEVDLSGLLRGAPSERWAAWKIAVDSKILDPDEVRLEEGFNPRPAGTAATN